MPVKIRLQRHGKKGKPFYHIVVADSRAKRDGRFIEKLGTYNPVAIPAQVELNIDAAVQWLQNGAQPTDTARSILSKKGVMLKKHLLGGVAKGAFSAEDAEKKFQTWVAEKEGKTQAEIDAMVKAQEEAKKARLAEEVKIQEARAAALAAVPAVEEEAPATEEVVAEETPATEEEAEAPAAE